MNPASNISPVKSAFLAVALLALVAAGLAIRGAASSNAPLGANDDYATRHPVVAAAQQLTTADDFGTRHIAKAMQLGLNDDYGTRNQPAPVELTTNDDFGTRHIVKTMQLGPNDDYGTRNR